MSASKKPDNGDADPRKAEAPQPPAKDRSAYEELRAVKEELARRVARQEDLHKGVLEMLKDIDKSEYELEEAGRMLRETRDQLVQSSKMTALGELAAGLAHELNQPLTVIKGLSRSLLNSSRPSTLNREKLQLIAGASDKMELIIKHLGIFSRSETAKTMPVDLAKTIDGALVMVRELLEENSISVEMELAPLPLIQGSPNRLEQVIINLVTNAKDAMPAGGVLGISASPIAVRGRKFVRLTISDTGCGIAEEHLSRIFDPFFTTKASGKGTGLGLSISYGIIKEHYGKISVESSPEGTAFRITLPIAHRHGPPKRPAEERRR